MLSYQEAHILTEARKILDREGSYTERKGRDDYSNGYTASKADAAMDAIFEYLNCAANYTHDKNAEKAIEIWS